MHLTLTGIYYNYPETAAPNQTRANSTPTGNKEYIQANNPKHTGDPKPIIMDPSP
jgi:hypothetical protein